MKVFTFRNARLTPGIGPCQLRKKERGVYLAGENSDFLPFNRHTSPVIHGDGLIYEAAFLWAGFIRKKVLTISRPTIQHTATAAVVVSTVGSFEGDAPGQITVSRGRILFSSSEPGRSSLKTGIVTLQRGGFIGVRISGSGQRWALVFQESIECLPWNAFEERKLSKRFLPPPLKLVRNLSTPPTEGGGGYRKGAADVCRLLCAKKYKPFPRANGIQARE